MRATIPTGMLTAIVTPFDEDLRDFEVFIESRASALERHRDRRWVYGWRADRDPKAAKVLSDWARAEDEFGETDTAIAVYSRLSEAEPGRRDALEARCRLKLHAVPSSQEAPASSVSTW